MSEIDNTIQRAAKRPVPEIKMDFDYFIAMLESRLDVTYTDEQIEFIKSFYQPTINTADPGTGKTASAVAGILCAEFVYGIKAQNIYALSFTNEATAELKVRHEKACDKFGVKSLVNFKTLDALCSEVIKENFRLLSFDGFDVDSIDISEPMTVEDTIEYIQNVAIEEEIAIPQSKLKQVVFAIRSLNSALIFSKDHVESKEVFKKTGLEYEELQIIRKRLYVNSKIKKRVRANELTMYALEILIKDSSISEKYKDRNKLILVDEFQDMSDIKLEFLKRITTNLIVIGDMKQQIYGFNGASLEIFDKYKEAFPECNELHLTKSFRCPEKVAEYSKMQIKYNNIGGEDFTGRDAEGDVYIHSDFDLDALCASIRKDLDDNHNKFSRQIMFTYRNNYSVVPIVEKLYQAKIPIIMYKHQEAHKLPVIKDLVGLMQIIRNPVNLNSLEILNKLVPEFTKHIDRPYENPIYKIMKKENIGFFDIEYGYKDNQLKSTLNRCMIAANKLYQENAQTREIFNALYPFYSEYYLYTHEKHLEQPASYYVRLVQSMTHKPFNLFIADEVSKAEFVVEWTNKRFGVKCLTFHLAKGLESDVVHIIDAEDGLIPNKKRVEDGLKMHCVIDTARNVRNERSLVFVAVTRTKGDLHIHYREKLATMFTSENEFESLDMAYETCKLVHDDLEVFSKFYE